MGLYIRFQKEGKSSVRLRISATPLMNFYVGFIGLSLWLFLLGSPTVADECGPVAPKYDENSAIGQFDAAGCHRLPGSPVHFCGKEMGWYPVGTFHPRTPVVYRGPNDTDQLSLSFTGPVTEAMQEEEFAPVRQKNGDHPFSLMSSAAQRYGDIPDAVTQRNDVINGYPAKTIQTIVPGTPHRNSSNTVVEGDGWQLSITTIDLCVSASTAVWERHSRLLYVISVRQ